MKKITFLILTLATTLALHAQVAINKTGIVPDNSAMLDVQSTTTGMLVPRMNTTQRTTISSPANGLLVYDTTTQSFWFYQNSAWTELRAGNITSLSDADGDTKVIVDNGTDGDTIAFYSKGVNVFSMDSMRLIPKWNSIYIGRNAGGTSVNENDIAIGDSTLFNNDPAGGKNIAIGSKSLYSNSIGFLNTAVGTNTLFSNYSGTENTAVGSYAMRLATGSHSVAFGSCALYNNWGWYNTALGYMSLSNNTSGAPNVAVGAYALYTNSTGSNLVAVGDSALYFNTGQNNTAIGSKALFSNTTGFNNTASGSHALYSNSTGYYNTATGGRALFSNISGNTNVAIGISALYSNTTNSNLVAVGDSALYNNTDGNDNTATGSKALFNNTTGNHNTVMGSRTMYANISGAKNTALGYRTFYSHSSGNGNTILGSDAMSTNTSGAYNVAVGANAGTNLSSGSNNIIIGGNFLDFPSATNSNQLNIANIIYGIDIDGTANTVSSGNIGIGVMYPEERLHVDGKIRTDYTTDVYWATYIDNQKDYNFSYHNTLKSYIDDVDGTYFKYSDKRLKTSIIPMRSVLPSVLSLKPVTYTFISDKTNKPQIGLIAQDVEKLFPQAVGEKNGYKSINYAVFGVLAIEAIKEQQKEIDDQSQQLEKQNERIDDLKQEVSKMKAIEQRLDNLEKQITNK